MSSHLVVEGGREARILVLCCPSCLEAFAGLIGMLSIGCRLSSAKDRKEKKKKNVSVGPLVVSPVATLRGSRRGALVASLGIFFVLTPFLDLDLVCLLTRSRRFLASGAPRDRDTNWV